LDRNANRSWVEEMEEVNVKGLNLVSIEARFKSTNENLCRRSKKELLSAQWLMHSKGGDKGVKGLLENYLDNLLALKIR
jgi:hypothetical protein